MASVTAAQQALSTDVAGLTVENNPNLAAPGSPMSSASSVFDGSNFSDLSIDDDFEFVNSYSEDEDVRSIWSERDEDTTPSASYLNKAARQRTITSTSSENGLKPSPSKMSFSFPDPEDDDVWVHPQAPSHDLGLEAVAQTPTIPSAVTSEGEEEECVNVGLNESCTSMESIADTEEEAPVAHRNVVPGDGWDGMPETVSVSQVVELAKRKSISQLITAYFNTLQTRNLWSAAAISVALLATGTSFLLDRSASVAPYPAHSNLIPIEKAVTFSAVSAIGLQAAVPLLAASPTLPIVSLPPSSPLIQQHKNMALITTETKPCLKCALSHKPNTSSASTSKLSCSRSHKGKTKRLLTSAAGPISVDQQTALIISPSIDLYADLAKTIELLQSWQLQLRLQSELGYGWFSHHSRTILPLLAAFNDQLGQFWVTVHNHARLAKDQIAGQLAPAEQEALKLMSRSLACVSSGTKGIVNRPRALKKARQLVRKADRKVVNALVVDVVKDTALRGGRQVERLRRKAELKLERLTQQSERSYGGGHLLAQQKRHKAKKAAKKYKGYLSKVASKI